MPIFRRALPSHDVRATVPSLEESQASSVLRERRKRLGFLRNTLAVNSLQVHISYLYKFVLAITNQPSGYKCVQL